MVKYVIKFKTEPKVSDYTYYAGRTYRDKDNFRYAKEGGLKEACRFKTKNAAERRARKLFFVCENVCFPKVEEVPDVSD